jgi:hypothetical protein
MTQLVVQRPEVQEHSVLQGCVDCGILTFATTEDEWGHITITVAERWPESTAVQGVVYSERH